MKTYSSDELSNKLLDVILAEEKLTGVLLNGELEASASALEAALTSLTQIAARLSAVHLIRVMQDGVEMREVMLISDEIRGVVGEVFDECVRKDLVEALDPALEEKATRVKPTSH